MTFTIRQSNDNFTAYSSSVISLDSELTTSTCDLASGFKLLIQKWIKSNISPYISYDALRT